LLSFIVMSPQFRRFKMNDWLVVGPVADSADEKCTLVARDTIASSYENHSVQCSVVGRRLSRDVHRNAIRRQSAVALYTSGSSDKE
jgi:hypothetical protein